MNAPPPPSSGAARGLAPARWRDLDTRGRAAVAGALALLVAAAGLAIVRWPAALGDLHELTAANRALSPTDRDIGARYLDISPEFLFAARATIPEDATFSVVVGEDVEVATPQTITAMPSYTAYFLLPRRLVDEPEAEWVLCYGCEPPAGTEVVWEGTDGRILRRGS